MIRAILVLMCALPLMVNAANPLKETIRAHRKYKSEKHHISNKVSKTKRTLSEISEGEYVENKLKRDVREVGDKYTREVKKVTQLTDEGELKRRAKNKLNREKRKAVDDWLYSD